MLFDNDKISAPFSSVPLIDSLSERNRVTYSSLLTPENPFDLPNFYFTNGS